MRSTSSNCSTQSTDCNFLLGTEDEQVEQTNLEPETCDTIKKQEAALKQLGGVRRYKMEASILEDLDQKGAAKLKNVKSERKSELNDEQERIRLIYRAVERHHKKMNKKMETVRKLSAELKEGKKRPKRAWEIKLDEYSNSS